MKSLVWAVLFVPVFGGVASRPLLAQARAAASSQYETLSVVLPQGDADAGRKAFLALQCTTCHRVAGEPKFPAPVADNQGPELNRMLRRRPASEVAEAIIVPSHSMSVRTSAAIKRRLQSMPDILSPMGDCGRVMTVRQFADLLAYLQTIDAGR